jgi:hypothetical protein
VLVLIKCIQLVLKMFLTFTCTSTIHGGRRLSIKRQATCHTGGRECGLQKVAHFLFANKQRKPKSKDLGFFISEI